MRHNWYLDEDGSIDEFASAFDFHNGPCCQDCYHSFCVHCDPKGYDDESCKGWKPTLPNLEKQCAEILMARDDESLLHDEWIDEYSVRGNLWVQPVHAAYLAKAIKEIELLKTYLYELGEVEFRKFVLKHFYLQ